jgi:hypothetical protein
MSQVRGRVNRIFKLVLAWHQPTSPTVRFALQEDGAEGAAAGFTRRCGMAGPRLHRGASGEGVWEGSLRYPVPPVTWPEVTGGEKGFREPIACRGLLQFYPR